MRMKLLLVIPILLGATLNVCVAQFPRCPVCPQDCSLKASRQKMQDEGINKVIPNYWVRINGDRPVCFQTKGNSPGKFKSPYDGFMSAVKLVHLYGSVTCDKRKELHYSYWGCNRNSLHMWKNFNIYLTDKKGNQLLKDNDEKDDLKMFDWFSSEKFTPNSKEFVFMNQKTYNPMYVARDFEMFIWYGDDRKDRNEDMSLGETCVDVYAHFV